MATFLFFKNQSGAGILHVLVAVYLTSNLVVHMKDCCSGQGDLL